MFKFAVQKYIKSLEKPSINIPATKEIKKEAETFAKYANKSFIKLDKNLSNDIVEISKKI